MTTTTSFPFEGSVHAPLHTHHVFDPNSFPDLIRDLTRRVWALKKKLNFDAIAGCGNSGLLVLGGVAARHYIPMWAVRKGADTEHDSRLANGFLVKGRVTRYLIIDDLIASGDTVNRIVKHISKVSNCMNLVGGFTQMSEPVGVLTYAAKYHYEFALEDGRKLPTFHIR